MKTYNYKSIQDLINPLMDMMREEYPNNAELVITSDFATIRYTLTDMNFMRKEVDFPREDVEKMAKAVGCVLNTWLEGTPGQPGEE